MDAFVLSVFAVVYLGMIAGKIPGLALDRTGVALLGAITLVAGGRISLEDAWRAIDVPTIGLLLGLMVVSAQFRLGGFYSRFTQRISALRVTPGALLALVIAAAAALSALLSNDIICLAMAPILADGCARRRLDPVPFLLALACAANVGSAATLIGNPQNMLIGQVLQIDFSRYLAQAIVPTAAGLGAVWLVIWRRYGGCWERQTAMPDRAVQPFDAWQTAKGLGVLAALVAAFLIGTWPRDVLALAAAGVLLMNRKMATRAMLELVDWQLLILFASLFIINHSMQQSGNLSRIIEHAKSAGFDPSQPAELFGASVALSNLVSNVPATMLLLPSAVHPLGGLILALSSTLAGNLLIVGSIANIIVVDQASRLGLSITWRDHARVGGPVTLLTLAVAAAWLALLV